MSLDDLLAELATPAASDLVSPAYLTDPKVIPFRITDITSRENRRFKKQEIAFTITLKSGESKVLSLSESPKRKAMLARKDEWVQVCKNSWLVLVKEPTGSGSRYTWAFAGA